MRGLKRQLSEESDSSNTSDEYFEHAEPMQFKNISIWLPEDVHLEAKDILHMMSTSKIIIYWNKDDELTYHKRAIPGSSLTDLLSLMDWQSWEFLAWRNNATR